MFFFLLFLSKRIEKKLRKHTHLVSELVGVTLVDGLGGEQEGVGVSHLVFFFLWRN